MPKPPEMKNSKFKINFASSLALTLLGIQITIAVFACSRFLNNISVFLEIIPWIIWIILCGIWSIIIIFRSYGMKNTWLIGISPQMMSMVVLHSVTAVGGLLLLSALNLGGFNKKMLDLVVHYRHNLQKKALMDEIQKTFNCCGVNNVTDWFFIGWKNDEIEPRPRRINLDKEGWDAVPYSCCALTGTPPCLNRGLITFGLDSVNSDACMPAVVNFFTYYLFVLTVLAVIIAILMAKLAAEGKQEDSLEEDVKKSARDLKWDEDYKDIEMGSTPTAEPQEKQTRKSQEVKEAEVHLPAGERSRLQEERSPGMSDAAFHRQLKQEFLEDVELENQDLGIAQSTSQLDLHLDLTPSSSGVATLFVQSPSQLTSKRSEPTMQKK